SARPYRCTPTTPTWQHTRRRSTLTILCAALLALVDSLAGQGRQQGARMRAHADVADDEHRLGCKTRATDDIDGRAGRLRGTLGFRRRLMRQHKVRSCNAFGDWR